MHPIRYHIDLVENNVDPHTYWTPGQVEHFAKYARALSFKTEQEARAFVEHKLNHWDQSWSLGGSNGPEKNQIIAATVPLYPSGKSFKIGKRIRVVKKAWDGVDVIRPSLQGLLEVGWINPFDGYQVLGIQMVPVRLLHMTEEHSSTESGQDKVYRYAQRVRDDQTFLAIIVDTEHTILDGHHRFLAIRDVLKWKKIACLVLRIGDD